MHGPSPKSLAPGAGVTVLETPPSPLMVVSSIVGNFADHSPPKPLVLIGLVDGVTFWHPLSVLVGCNDAVDGFLFQDNCSLYNFKLYKF